jgi:heterodisulfide reductase subunit A
MGFMVLLFEKEQRPGGHLAHWHVLFPDMQPASEVLDALMQKSSHAHIRLITGTEITGAEQSNGKWQLKKRDAVICEADAVLLASGFKLFNAAQKEEYGHGIYPSVITSSELEALFNHQRAWPFPKNLESPKIGMVHCVGSRDAKCGNLYCSKVCCVTAVKQAIELKKLFPAAQVYCFYMDMRMFGMGYEELYHQAQVDYQVQFIRGRLSEASPTEDHRLQVKAEDTLMGRPVKLTLDMLVLMVGMRPSVVMTNGGGSVELKDPNYKDGFVPMPGHVLGGSKSIKAGFFVAGVCKGPATLPEVANDAKAIALDIHNYLKGVV